MSAPSVFTAANCATAKAFDLESITVPPCGTGSAIQDLISLLRTTMNTIMDPPLEDDKGCLGVPLHATKTDGERGRAKPMMFIPPKMAEYITQNPNSVPLTTSTDPEGRCSYFSLPAEYRNFDMPEKRSYADHLVDMFNASGAGDPIKRE
jgi:hypothetical protein